MAVLKKHKTQSLEHKTLGAVTIIVIGLSLAIGGVSSAFSAQLAIKTSSELTNSHATRVIEDITSQMAAMEAETVKIASHSLQFRDNPYLSSFLQIRANNSVGIEEMYLTQSNGVFVTNVKGEFDETKYNMDSEWYKTIKANPSKLIFGDITFDSEKNTLYIEMGTGMIDYSDEFNGIVVAKVNLASILQSLSSTITEDSFPYLIDDKGNILFHMDENYKPTGPTNFSNIKEVGSEELLNLLEQPGELSSRYKSAENKQFIISKGNLGNNWTLAYVTNWDSIIAPVKKQIFAITITAILAGLFSLALLRIQLRKRLSPIKEITSHVEELSSGDLTVENLSLHTGTELDKLGEGINSLVSNLNQIISMAKNVSGTALETTDNLAKVADTNIHASSEVASTISEVADGVRDQTETCFSTTKNVHTLDAEMAEILKNVSSTLQSVLETIERSKTGTSIVEDLSVKNSLINDEMGKVSEKVTVLIESIKNISTISDDIEAISNQTHLLSLNASIEAAKAGEQGRGFSVVASEIRKLSEATAASNNKVAEISRNLIAEIVDIDKTTQKSMNVLSLQTASVSNTKTTFTEIDTDVMRINEFLNAIEDSIAAATKQTREVVESLTELSNVSEKNTAYSQEIAAKTEGQLKEMDSMKGIITQLQDTCVELETTVNHFKTK